MFRKKIDCQIFANDLGHAVISNSALISHSDDSESGMVSNFINDMLIKTISGLNADALGVRTNVASGAMTMVTSSVGFAADIDNLNGFAQSLQSQDLKSGFVTEKDNEVFSVADNQQTASFVVRVFNVVSTTFAYIAASLSLASPKFSAMLSNKNFKKLKQLAPFSKRNMHITLMKAQLEQQITALDKSLRVASAMKINEVGGSIADLYKQKFGMEIRGGEPLDDNSKAFFKIQALQMAAQAITDPEQRQAISSLIRLDKPVLEMSLQERNKYVDGAIIILVEHVEKIKLDAYYLQSKQEFMKEVSVKISSKKLNAHGITAMAIISRLLSTPTALEATKSIVMVVPFLNNFLTNCRTHFATLYRGASFLGLIQSTEPAIFGETFSPKKLLNDYIYGYGKMELDLKCADRMIGILQNNDSFAPADSSSMTQKVTKNFTSYALSKRKTTKNSSEIEKIINPYTGNRASVLAATFDESVRQVVELLKTTLMFIEKLDNVEVLQKEREELLNTLQQLCSDPIKGNEELRNKLMASALPLLAKLTDNYQLQKNDSCFEFMMLLRFAVGNISMLTNAATQFQEYMSYHGVSYSEQECTSFFESVKQTAMNETVGRGFKKPAELFSGGSVVDLQNALTSMPDGVTYSKIEAEAENARKAKHG